MKPRFLSIFFFFALLPLISFAQYEELLHRPYAQKLDAYAKLYLELIDLRDSTELKRKMAEVKAFALKNGDRELELEMELFNAYYHIELRKKRVGEQLFSLRKLIATAGDEGIAHIKIRGIRVLADYYWYDLKNYELAFEQYLLMEQELDRVNEKDYPEMPRDLAKIGEAYFFFQDYGRAIRYFKKAVSVPENDFNTMFLNSARNMLGLCYQQQKNYKLSDYYFNQIVQTKFAKPKVEWVRIAKGNIGANYYYRKQFDKAIPLLEFDFKGALQMGDYGPAAGAAILLADIFLYRGDMQLSWFYLTKAKENIGRAKQYDRLRFWYPVVSKWFAASGNTGQATVYLDSTVTAINSYQEKFSALKVLQAQQKINVKDSELKQTAFALENQKKINERNLVVLVAVGLVVLIVLVYLIQKRRRQAVEIDKLRIENELKKAQDEINLFVYKINEQSKITERFNEELEKLKNSESEEKKLLQKTVVELRSVKILTDEDWISFQQHFAKIFPDFIRKLKTGFPTVTEAELRYLMLSKLQLSHKEMAQALGVSADAVRVTWNRVRKKLDGTLSDTPQTLIARMGI